ncbi:hypothetical protein RN69_10005 [Bradyrhizobium japonicum]|nr:hypothetical protein RN69_10005 [Bradyrhizobium japonicum]KMJ99817.1 hypothetical protein CF64_03845 [Bradyrhizobium japonicum]
MRAALMLFLSPVHLAGRVRALESFDEPVEFPEFYVETVHQQLCLCSGLRLVRAIEINTELDVSVRAKDVGPIVSH